MIGYPLALYVHLLVFVGLLGADLGRAWLARIGAAPGTPPAARLLAVRAVLRLALVADLALILIFPAGFEVASILDAYRIADPAWRVAPWLLPGLLLSTSVAADVSASAGGGRALAAVDAAARAIVGAGQVWDGASVILLGMTHMVEANWLAAKLTIYGLLLLLSIPARRATLQLRRDRPAAGGGSVVALLQALQLPVLGNAVLVLIIAWLAIAKPA